MENQEKKYTGYGYHGGGRKRKSDGGRQSFNVSCTQEEKEKIKSLAKKNGLTVSEMIITSVFKIFKEEDANETCTFN